MGDILMLAGDIVPFAFMHKHADFFDWVADHFETTYWVPGNHEYYHSDIGKRSGQMNEQIRSNVILVNNTKIVRQNMKIIFTTLWSEIKPSNQVEIQQRFSDFHVIGMQGLPFTPDHYNALYHEAIPEFVIGNTRLITNQLGYVKYNEHREFDAGALIEIN